MKPTVNIIYNCIRESFFSLFFVAVYLGLSSPGGKEGSNSISNSIQTSDSKDDDDGEKERERKRRPRIKVQCSSSCCE